MAHILVFQPFVFLSKTGFFVGFLTSQREVILLCLILGSERVGLGETKCLRVCLAMLTASTHNFKVPNVYVTTLKLNVKLWDLLYRSVL